MRSTLRTRRIDVESTCVPRCYTSPAALGYGAGPWTRSASGSCATRWRPSCGGPPAGERMVVTVDGVAMAQLGPLAARARRAQPARPGRRRPASSRPAPRTRAGARGRQPPGRRPPRPGARRRSAAGDAVRRHLRAACAATCTPPGRDLVLSAMAADDAWCASALARTEVLLVLRQVAVHPRQQDELWASGPARLGRLLGGADRRPLPQPGGGDRRHLRRAPPSTPSTWPPPTACPGRCATPPSTAARSPPPPASASRSSHPSPAGEDADSPRVTTPAYGAAA